MSFQKSDEKFIYSAIRTHPNSTSFLGRHVWSLQSFWVMSWCFDWQWYGLRNVGASDAMDREWKIPDSSFWFISAIIYGVFFLNVPTSCYC